VGGAYHFVSTLGAPAGYSFETSVGQVSMVSEPNTHPLFSCMNGSSDQFVSPDSNCEGQKGLGLIGFAFNSAPSGVPSVLLERCIVTGNNSHFVSNDPNCEGQRPEGSLGYALASLA
jgi:hypothetical protein